jgi:hypothetical protein
MKEFEVDLTGLAGRGVQRRAADQRLPEIMTQVLNFLNFHLISFKG